MTFVLARDGVCNVARARFRIDCERIRSIASTHDIFSSAHVRTHAPFSRHGRTQHGPTVPKRTHVTLRILRNARKEAARDLGAWQSPFDEWHCGWRPEAGRLGQAARPSDATPCRLTVARAAGPRRSQLLPRAAANSMAAVAAGESERPSKSAPPAAFGLRAHADECT